MNRWEHMTNAIEENRQILERHAEKDFPTSAIAEALLESSGDD